MSGLLLEQETLLSRISRSYINFKKDGSAKMTASNCNIRMQNLEKIWSNYEINHSKLLLDNSDEIKKSNYFKTDQFATAEELYLEKRIEFQTFLDSMNIIAISPTANQMTKNFEDSERLPAISLPKFKGEFCEWESFRDLFTTLVINKSHISNVTKLHHLKLSLEGDAARLVNNYAITEENFAIAWQKLKDRYENKRRLVSAHLSSIFSMKPMKKESSHEIKRLISGISSPLAALETLKRSVSHWDDLLVFHVVSLLAPELRRQWEKHLGNDSSSLEPPSYKFLMNFLENQITVLEALEDSEIKTAIKPTTSNYYKPNKFSTVKSHHVAPSNSTKCPLCNDAHFFLHCGLYKSKSPTQRKEIIVNQKRCFNCLSSHNVKNCASKKRCYICHGKHHSSIHINVTEARTSEPSVPLVSKNMVCDEVSSNLCKLPNHVLLATAVVQVFAENRNFTYARALIDQGSQSSFISESLYQRLKLSFKSVDVPISGVGGRQTFTCRKLVLVTLKARFNSDFSCPVDAFVIPKITSYAPELGNNNKHFEYLEKLVLADPYFAERGQIELLLGSSIHAKIIEGQIIRGQTYEPIAMKSALGWIVSGDASSSDDLNLPSVLHIANDDMSLNDMLGRFFAQEEFSNEIKYFSPEETENENIFVNSFSRDDAGRYTVRLPFKEKDSNLLFPNIFDVAMKMLCRMETKFERDREFGLLYREFMADYIDRGHMVEMKGENSAKAQYFLPHHGLLKRNSAGAKLRTVFNGSAKAANGLSINDMLHVGRNLLPNLTELILRWRKYKFVFVSDIKQMFRQIRIHSDDQPFQAILWRFNPNEPVRKWYLQTVTYGMVSSPYLAVRVTHQLASDEEKRFPLGADILKNETYMDDNLSGGHTSEELYNKMCQLKDICREGGFSLHKWLSNNHELLQSIPEADRAIPHRYEFDTDATFSVLGLSWNPDTDSFLFKVENELDNCSTVLTKRKILSKIAKLFDPLGWLAPALITAKIFMQQLWIKRIGWDEELDSELVEQWLHWYSQLSNLNNIEISRWLGYNPDAKKFELHGFADAAKLAYGAVVYLRIIYEGNVVITVLQAKTKVSPIKPLLTIPRLELSAAVLLAKLANKLSAAIDIKDISLHLWSDSTDVLFWLKDHPSRWPIFIANRCSKIHTLVPNACWRHVRSGDNPADCLSRGISPSDLGAYRLWWQGPKWLSDETRSFEVISEESKDYDILPMSSSTATISPKYNTDSKVWDLETRFSTLQKLTRVTAFILKFIDNLINRCKFQPKIKLFTCKWYTDAINNNCKSLSTLELTRARLVWVYLTQHNLYRNELNALRKNRPIHSSSILLKLDPFIHDNLLRVGGRLQHSFLEFEEMHTLILPYNCNFSVLLVKFFHLKTLHGGIKLTLSTLRAEFWIVRAKQLVKSTINNCYSCLRYRGSTMYQKLANLPPFRTRPSRPFLKSGVDYAGPFNLRTSAGRGQKSYKGYMAVFICLSTRAVHLELVSSYASKEFIAAFRRFTSRRGFCSDLYSDRGTTFVGADKELKELFEKCTPFIFEISETLSNEGTNWHFNPPAAPHFGGIWEAAVKSAKYHLKRVISSHTPTFEEFYTLLTQVEACLNSRPLVALGDDVSDIQPLTPAHFLINSPSYIVPETDCSEVKISPSERWRLIQQMLAHWWKRWSREYLQSLQIGNKWRTTEPCLQINDIVLITDENNPPAKWPLARVIKIFPANDGQVRVVRLRTSTNELDRPVAKLVFLSKNSCENTV